MPLDFSDLPSAGESNFESSDDEESASTSSSFERRESNWYRTHRSDGAKTSSSQIDIIDRLWSRCILLLDIDCFYCQCEELDGPPDYKERPLAIGQKHIIVTSNYVAREAGVKKLQSRDEAKRICPNLLIIEGSDLERYRVHSRNVYNAFRKALRNLSEEARSKVDIPARKGGFDEMFADITAAVDFAIQQGSHTTLSSHAYVFDASSSRGPPVYMTEDQSGATSLADHASRDELSPFYNGHVGFLESQKTRCSNRLRVAADFAEKIRRAIKDETGFTTTIGVSVSPMLSKLASELKKPNSLNILYPWKSARIILPMPLRKIPEIGHRTLSLLKPCLRQYHRSDPDFWTCRDLLRIPKHEVQASLEKMKSHNFSNSSLRCDLLLEKCRGVDSSSITDDNGGISKTLSVENSFRRDTVLSRKAVWDAMEDLFERLARLLDQRRSDSNYPDRAFPATVRVTARMVDGKIKKRRPFVTKSKQSELRGRSLMNSPDVERHRQLRSAAKPLLDSLLPHGDTVNVTRLSIALTNFADLSDGVSGRSSSCGSFSRLLAVAPKSTTQTIAAQQDTVATKKRIGGGTCNARMDGSRRRIESLPSRPGPSSRSYVDLAVLAELPLHIVEEVRLQYGITEKRKAQRTIDKFFSRKNE